MKQQRVAIVTGAGRGIGQAVAVALARTGFALCLAARTREHLEQTRMLTGLAPGLALLALIDLADDDAPDNLIDTASAHFGRLDVLVNNAGFAPPRTPLAKLSAADQDRMLAVNLRAPVALTRLAARKMAQQAGGGVIINIASRAARHAAAGEAVYAASKAGLVAFTHACSEEFRHSNLRTSVILPGLTDTQFIPHNKRLDRSAMLRPEDVAAAVMNVVNADPAVCPLEVVLEPAREPMRAGGRA